MQGLRSIFFLFLAFCASLSWGQMVAPSDYKLGPGDAIKVQVFQNPDLTTEARVSETGSIRFPLIGSVDLGGLSIGQAAGRVADALR